MKEQILNKLSNEEIQWIIDHPNDFKQPKKPQLECEIGDCFFEISSVINDVFSLYKVTAITSSNIEFEEINVCTVSGNIDLLDDYLSKEIAYEHFEPINAELYDSVREMVTSLDDQVNSMYKECALKIKNLCSNE